MYWFIFCKSDIVLLKCADGSYTIPQGETPPVETKPWTTIHTITPMNNGEEVRCFAVDRPVTDKTQLEMCPLRQSFYKLAPELYQKAGKCQEIIYWDMNTRFCGVCGGQMKLHTDISKRCTECGKEVWPQLATATITLIHRGDEVLLVKCRNFRTDFYGLVAGFVETGESLEEAARREILEEVGVKVKNMRYVSSQPWPYPSGLMVGFIAEYDSGDIVLQKEEIADGGWFHRENLPNLPEKLSIARQLIDYWLETKINK